jgi:hypothetical protein
MRSAKRTKLILATLLVCYACIELFSYIAYSLIVTSPQTVHDSEPQIARSHLPRYIPHPFIGYTYRKNSTIRDTETFKTNKWGFPASKDKQFSTNDNNYIVAITGGSVAMQLFLNEQNKIRNELQKLPQLKDRKVSVISLSVGGYSQPQQLMAVVNHMIMGGKLDLLINLDGFNEANNVYVTPYRWQEMMTFSPKSWAIVGRVHFLQQLQDMCAQWMHKLRYSMTAKLALHITHDIIEQHVQSAWKTMSADTENKMELFEERINGKHIEVWKSSAAMLNKIMDSNGGVYAGFIQPNLYVKNSKPFTAKEIKMMNRDWADGYKKISARISEGYTLLGKAASQLQKEEKLHVYNMEKLFQNTKETVYSDTCCHMNEKGLGMMSDFILSKLGLSLQRM